MLGLIGFGIQPDQGYIKLTQKFLVCYNVNVYRHGNTSNIEFATYTLHCKSFTTLDFLIPLILFLFKSEFI